MKAIVITFILFVSVYAKTLTISTGEWSPWVSQDLESYGIGATITKEAFKVSNIHIKFNFYPWKRAYKSAKTLQNDASGFWLKTKQREKDFYFSEPVFSIKNKLVFKTGKDIKIDSIEDLKNYKIAVTRGYSYTTQIDKMIKNKDLNVYIVNNDLAGLKQLLKKDNFDAFLCSENVAKSLISKKFSDKDKSQFELSKNDVFRKDVYLIVSKKHKDYKKIINDFNKGLKFLKESKEIKKIINGKY